jgi:hypothetical protein
MSRSLTLFEARTFSPIVAKVALVTAILTPPFVRVLPEAIALPLFIVHCVIVIVASILAIALGAFPERGRLSSWSGIGIGLLAFVAFLARLNI